MSHIQRFLKGDEMTRVLWSMIPETLAFAPLGIGIVPYALPSSVDVLCKAANIYMCARAMGSEPDGMTAEQMKEVQDVFQLPKKRPC